MNTNLNYLNDILLNRDKHPLNLIVKKAEVKDAILKLKGYKHSMVQIIALSIAWNLKLELTNPPLVLDTYVFCEIINSLGGNASIVNDKLIIDPTSIKSYSIPSKLSNLIHGSVYLIPALLVRFGKVEFFGSGGCQIGDNETRPIQHVLDILKMFGTEVTENDGKITCYLEKINELKEVDIMDFSTDKKVLEGPFVGGVTKIAILLSHFQNNICIKNAYIKTDVIDMLRFISDLKVKITVQNNNISIENANLIDDSKLISFELTECISEIITYSTFAIINNISVRFKDINKNVISQTLFPEFVLFEKMGINYEWVNNDLVIKPTEILNEVDICVTPSSIQSDHQPFFALMLALKSKGVSKITENVWKSRFYYINNLNKLGTNISLQSSTITITPSVLNNVYHEFEGKDVRTCAVTLLAIINSNSNSKIKNCEHILRGYDSLIENFKLFGVDLSIEKEEI